MDYSKDKSPSRSATAGVKKVTPNNSKTKTKPARTVKQNKQDKSNSKKAIGKPKSGKAKKASSMEESDDCSNYSESISSVATSDSDVPNCSSFSERFEKVAIEIAPGRPNEIDVKYLLFTLDDISTDKWLAYPRHVSMILLCNAGTALRTEPEVRGSSADVPKCAPANKRTLVIRDSSNNDVDIYVLEANTAFITNIAIDDIQKCVKFDYESKRFAVCPVKTAHFVFLRALAEPYCGNMVTRHYDCSNFDLYQSLYPDPSDPAFRDFLKELFSTKNFNKFLKTMEDGYQELLCD